MVWLTKMLCYSFLRTPHCFLTSARSSTWGCWTPCGSTAPTVGDAARTPPAMAGHARGSRSMAHAWHVCGSGGAGRTMVAAAAPASPPHTRRSPPCPPLPPSHPPSRYPHGGEVGVSTTSSTPALPMATVRVADGEEEGRAGAFRQVPTQAPTRTTDHGHVPRRARGRNRTARSGAAARKRRC